MRIDDEFSGDTSVEIGVTLWGLIQRDHRGVDRLRDANTIVKNRHHQSAVLLHDWCLAGQERVGFGPTETEPQTESSGARSVVLGARIVGHIQTGNTNGFGTRRTMPPQRLSGKGWSVGVVEDLEVAAGERVRFTGTNPQAGYRNGERGVVEAIAAGLLTVDCRGAAQRFTSGSGRPSSRHPLRRGPGARSPQRCRFLRRNSPSHTDIRRGPVSAR